MPRMSKESQETLAKVLSGIILVWLVVYCSGLGTSNTSNESSRDTKPVAPASAR